MKVMMAEIRRGKIWNTRTVIVLVCLILLNLIGLSLSGGLSEAEAAITVRQVGLKADNGATFGNLTLTVPVLTQENDVMIMMISAKDNIVVTLPAGWTKFNELNNGTGLRSTMAWKRAGVGEGGTTVTVTHAAGNVAFGVIVSFAGVISTGTPVNASLSTANASSNTVTANAITPTTANSMIIFTAFYGDDSTSAGSGFGSYSGTNPTFTEAFDAETITGTDTSMALAYGVKTDTTTTGSRTCTAAPATTAVNIGALTALTPDTKTFAGVAVATAASATSISVNMRFSGDVDVDNSCSTRYKLSTSSTWSSPATGCVVSGNALTKTISTLTEAEYYDVEMTYVDPDGIVGTAVQTSYNIALGPSNKTTAGLATIRVILNTAANPPGEILVRMPFENDANSSNSYTIKYKLSSLPDIPANWTTLGPYSHTTADVFKQDITLLTLEERYDIQLIYTDADGTAGVGGTQTYTNVYINPSIHNSYNYSMRKWNGKWGISGGQYGEFVCTTCHERFPTNIKRIKSSGPITAPDTSNGNFPGSGTTVSFLSAVDGSSDFGNDASAHSSSTKICEVCHSVPEYHKYNQLTAASHFNASNCIQCHNHATGFYPAGGQCVNCHGQAQSQMYMTRQITGAGGDFVRMSHHVNDGTTTAIVTNYDCAICHREADADLINTGEGWLDLYNHKNGSTATSRYVMLRNVDNRNAGWKWNKYAPTTSMRNDMDSFCMGCHDADGASDIAVNNSNNGFIFGSASTTATVRTVTGANNSNANNVTLNLRPFNTNDTLVGNTTDFANTTLRGFKTGNAAGTTYGRVLNVKDQFNSTNQTGSNWASHHNLNQFTKRYGARNTTYFPNNIFNNVDLLEGNLVTLGENIGLHCADCHLNEANAHGAANSRYALQDSSGTDTAWSGASNTDGGTEVCYKCHSAVAYDEASTGYGRFDHSRDASRTLNTITSPMGIICFNCHGGFSSGSQGGLGAIHGTNETYNPGGSTATTKRYRFMSGSVMRFYRPAAVGTTNITDADWTGASTANSCYTVASGYTDTFVSGCSQHGTGVNQTSGDINYSKPLSW